MMLHEKALVWMSLCAAPKGTPRFSKICYAFFGIFTGLIALCFITTSAITFVLMITTDLPVAFFAVSQVAATTSELAMFLAVPIYRSEIKRIFDEFNATFDQCKDDKILNFYIMANNRSRKFDVVFIIGMAAAFVFEGTALGILTICQSYFSDDELDPSTFYLPVALPWSINTVTRYVESYIYGMVFGVSYFYVTTTFLAAFYRCSLYFYANRLHFQELTLRLGENASDETITKSLLCDIARFHLRARDLCSRVSKVFSGVLFFQIVCGIVYISCTLFNNEMIFSSSKLHIGVATLDFILSSFGLYLYCHIGAVTTSNFTKYPGYLYESNWYEFPHRLRKYIVIMIGNAQPEIIFYGYGLFLVNLETHRKVLNTSIGYYVMFRTLSASKI